MRNAIAAFILAASIGSAVALATCAHARSPGPCDGNPNSGKCDPGMFVDQILGGQQWYQSRFAREIMLRKCTDPLQVGRRPPVAWCRAAAAAELGHPVR